MNQHMNRRKKHNRLPALPCPSFVPFSTSILPAPYVTSASVRPSDGRVSNVLFSAAAHSIFMHQRRCGERTNGGDGAA